MSNLAPRRPSSDTKEWDAALVQAKRIGLGLSIGLNLTLSALPLLLIGGVIATLAYWSVMAEVLEHIGWLPMKRFTTIYWASFGMVVLSLGRVLWRQHQKKTRFVDELRTLAIGHLTVLAIILSLELPELVDLPDSLAAFVLLMAGISIEYLTLILPVWVTWRLGRDRWRAAITSGELGRSASTQALFVSLWLALGIGVWSSLPNSAQAFVLDDLGDEFSVAELLLPGSASDTYLALDNLSAVLELKPAPPGRPARSLDEVFLDAPPTAAASPALNRRSPYTPVRRDGPQTQKSRAFNQCANTLATEVGEHQRQSLLEREISRLTRKGVQRVDAEDFVMGALLAVCEQASREAIADLKPYFVRVVQNQLRNYKKGTGRYRHRHRTDRYASLDHLLDPKLDLVRFEQDELIRVVRTFESTLKAGDREILDLRYQQGLEPREIATIIGVSPQTARKRLQRATDRLRAALEIDKKRYR